MTGRAQKEIVIENASTGGLIFAACCQADDT